jgi:hypothetical protein
MMTPPRLLAPGFCLPGGVPWECSKRRHSVPLLTQPRIGKTPEILPVAFLRRKLSGSRPGLRSAISFARRFAPAITSPSLVRTEVSVSTGTPRLSQSIANIFCCLPAGPTDPLLRRRTPAACRSGASFSIPHQYPSFLTASCLNSRRSRISLQRLPISAEGRQEGSAGAAYHRAIIRAIRIDDGGGLAIGAGQVVRHLMYTFKKLHNTDLSCIATTPKADGCSGECSRWRRLGAHLGKCAILHRRPRLTAP